MEVRGRESDSAQPSRAEFLGLKVGVWLGHWGGWVILTHPYVDRVYVNQALTKAKLDFALLAEGGNAFFERTAEGWKMTSSRMTWIE